jgi:uncharacterized protein YcnI
MKKSLKSVGACAIALGAGILLALTPAAAASAHVSATATSTAAGSSTVVTFSVPHGCDGSPTTVVTIEVPEAVPAVTPTVNPNWTVEKVVEQLAEPLTDAHGNEIAERVTSVVYTTTGAGLADGYRDTFELSLRLPEGQVGDVVAFPVVQTCAEGTAEWVGEDAPSVTLTAVESGGHDDGHDEAAAEATSSTSDPLARVFGIAGLVVGAVGVVIAVLGRRSAKA